MFKANRVLLRIIYAHLVSGVLLTALLLAVVSPVLSARIERTAAEAAQALMSQAYQTTRALLADTYSDFYVLWTRNDRIQQALGPAGLPAGSPDGAASVASLLDATARSNEIVHSVQLINRDTGLVHSDRLATPQRLEDAADPGAVALLRDFALNYDAWRDEVFFPRALPGETPSGQQPLDLLSVIFATRAADGEIHAGLVVNIDRARLARLVSTVGIPGQLLIVSQTGRLTADLSSPAESRSPGAGDPANDPGLAEALQQILASPGETGSLTGLSSQEQTLFVFQKAAPLGFVFVRALPVRLLQAESRATNRVVAALFAAAMLIGLIISAGSVWFVYHPLNRLVRRVRAIASPSAQVLADEYDFLHAATSALHEQSRVSGLVRLIFGQADAAVLDSLGFSGPAFTALAIAPDQADRTGADFIEHLRLLADGLPGWNAAVAVPDSVSVILNQDLRSDSAMATLLEQAIDLQNAVRQQLGHSIAIGIGLSADSPEGLRTSHRQALAALQQALDQGEGQLVQAQASGPGGGAARQNRSAVAEAVSRYIDEHLADPDLAPDAIAGHVGLSPGYLRQLFRIEYGETISEYIISRRIEQARHLLATTERTAKDIAEEVGFLDSRYFYTVFRKRTGETTESYRSRSRQQAGRPQPPDASRNGV